MVYNDVANHGPWRLSFVAAAGRDSRDQIEDRINAFLDDLHLNDEEVLSVQFIPLPLAGNDNTTVAIVHRAVSFAQE